jgi:N-acetylglucosamine-6-phosphate deacetylase
MSGYAMTASQVFDGERMREQAIVVIDGPRIIDVLDRRVVGSQLPFRDLGGGILAPGFIDLQVNGGGGVLFNDTPTVEGAMAIAAAHRRFGTTSLLPTVITDAPEVMQAAAAAVSQAIKQRAPGIIGIHIEGPYIDVNRKGAHDARFIRKPTEQDVAWLCGLECGHVLVTVAPNCVSPDVIGQLYDADVIVSLGHSDANADQAIAALAAGATGFTHLFNAMSQMTGRAPGMVGTALADPDPCCGIIADGHHVDPITLRTAIRAFATKPHAFLYFVSDAMPSAAGGPPRFELQGRPVEVVKGRLQLADGTLAGANITMLDAVRYGIAQLDLSLEESLRMASLRPAQYIGRGHTLGRVKAGTSANLVHLSDTLDVLETWIDGVSSHPERSAGLSAVP